MWNVTLYNFVSERFLRKVGKHQDTQRHIPGDRNTQLQRSENFKSRKACELKLFVFGVFETTFQRDTQCLYNVTLRRVRLTIVSWEKTSITYSECVFVALGIKHVMLKRHIIICGPPRFTIFFRITSQTA